MLHGDDDFFGPGYQVHCAAHAADGFSGNHPVGQVSLFVHLQTAQDGGVQVAASGHGEGHHRVKAASAWNQRNKRVVGIGQIPVSGPPVSVAVPVLFQPGDAAVPVVPVPLKGKLFLLSNGAVLAVEPDGDILGQVIAGHGGQADTQVHEVAVMQHGRDVSRDDFLFGRH